MPVPQEVAVLEVAGNTFEDWETVMVELRWLEPFNVFQFTCAERDPIFNKPGFPQWTKLQFKPGDSCSITLAGQLAITGVIITRQVAYDAANHSVQLIGKSTTSEAAKSSVDTPTGNFDNKNVVQAAQEVCGTYGCAVKVIGSPDLTPFPKLQNEKGELVWDFLERIARPRGVIMGADPFGNFLMIGEHDFAPVGQLIEGINIKSCQCVISIEEVYENYEVGASHPASDDNSGTAASELKGVAPGIGIRSKLITPAEQPVKTQAEVQARAHYEQLWHDGTLIQATIVVQGWLNGDSLWQAGDEVHVYSPMAMLDTQLKIQSARFTQDNQNGTQTTLNLVSPEYLRGQGGVDVGPGLQDTSSTSTSSA